jgi:hypothetical protein
MFPLVVTMPSPPSVQREILYQEHPTTTTLLPNFDKTIAFAFPNGIKSQGGHIMTARHAHTSSYLQSIAMGRSANLNECENDFGMDGGFA